VVGHVWPVFFRFRGGKGAATLVGALLMLWPLLLLVPALTWLLLMAVTGYVGLSTMVAGAMLVPVAAWAAAPDDRALWIAAAIAIASFLVFTHRSNIQRLRAGNEHRFERIRVIGRWWAGRR
jgi:glycerol-3-phosphate acyltransferase PlsY